MMTAAEPEDTGMLEHLASLVDRLGDADWRKRQAAVAQLAAHRSPFVVSQLVSLIQRDHRNLSRLNAAIQVLTRTELDVVPALRRLLTDPHAEVRASAALTLGERGEVDATDGLVAALSDPDTNVRVHVIEALGKLRAAAAVDALIKLVEALDFELAFPALDALAAIGDGRVAHRLIPLLQNDGMQEAAIAALGLLGDEECAVFLLNWRAPSNAAALKTAVAIGQIHNRYLRSYGISNIAKLVRESGSPAMVAILRSSLSGLTHAEQLAVIEVLGWLPGAAAEDALLDRMDQPNLHRAIADALSARGPGITGTLLERLGDASHQSRLGLIELLGRIADRGPVPRLLQCLHEEDEAVIAKALDAFALLGDARVYSHALARLGHSSPRVRQAAVAAINSLGHPATATDMQRLLGDSSTVVCESAVKITGYFGFSQCVDALIACCDHTQEQIRRVAVEHLVCVEDDRVVPRLEQALRSGSAAVRAAAAGAFGEMDASVAIPHLVAALEDQDVWVRYFAVRSLAKVDRSSAHQEKLLSLANHDPAMQVRIASIEALQGSEITALAELAGSAEDDIAMAALRALGATRQPAALPALVSASCSENPLRRAQAVGALGELGLPGAIRPLYQTAIRRRDQLAEEAIAALGQIGCAESATVLLAIAGHPAKRSAAVAALVGLGEPAVPTLAWHLHNSPLEMRLVAVEVLICIRTANAIEVLETALSDTEPAVRYRTLSGLAHVRGSFEESSPSIRSEGSV